MKLTKPKDEFREVFFPVQHFDLDFYLRYYGFVHFLMHLNDPALDCCLAGFAGYSLVFSKWYSYLESNKKIIWLNPQAGLPG
jgi:hypothetical protein